MPRSYMIPLFISSYALSQQFSGTSGQSHLPFSCSHSAYAESMEECLAMKSAVPQWYLALEDGQIIGGLGVIENDLDSSAPPSPFPCSRTTLRS